MGGDQQQGMGTGGCALTHVQLGLPSGDLLKQNDLAGLGLPPGWLWRGQLTVDGTWVNRHLTQAEKRSRCFHAVAAETFWTCR